MESRTKYVLSDEKITEIFSSHGITGIKSIKPLGAGEYNAVYEVIAHKPYVLKVAPSRDAAVLEYEKNMMRTEVYWYKVMRDKTDISVPQIYYEDYSKTIIPTDYFIMEKMSGRQKDKMDFTPDEKKEAKLVNAKMIAQLHAVHNDKFGYIQNKLYDNWYDAYRSMVENLINDCKKAGKSTKSGVKLLGFTAEYEDILKSAECSMVNFDCWDPNIICSRENGRIKYSWIDPERSFWGDKIFDFVCLNLMKPLDNNTDVLKAYNSAAREKVNITENEIIRYALAHGLLALIMETEKYYRYSPGHFGWWRNIVTSKALYSFAFKNL